MKQQMIKIDKLTKNFNEVVALNNFSAEIPKIFYY